MRWRTAVVLFSRQKRTADCDVASAGLFREKRAYVLGQIQRTSGYRLEEEILKDIDRLVTFRNRIVHMSFQAKPGKYKPILNTAQMAHIAALAGDTARHYLDFLSETFSELRANAARVASEGFPTACQ
jgi:hypothetical protein